jgi:hypothetical protein
MRVGEKIKLRNLGECVVMVENNDTILVNKNKVCYFVVNPNKKRQEEEYSYDNAMTYGFTVEEAFQLIQPLYAEIINNTNKQYKINNELSKMLIEAYSKTI